MCKSSIRKEVSNFLVSLKGSLIAKTRKRIENMSRKTLVENLVDIWTVVSEPLF